MIKFSRLNACQRIGGKLTILWLSTLPFLITSCSVPATNSSVIAVKQNNFAPIEYEEQTRVVRNLLLQNEFTKVEGILNEALDRQWLTRGGSLHAALVLDEVFNLADPKFLTTLERWIDRYPQSSWAYTARAYFYYDYAWSFRGNKYVNKTPGEALQKYTQQIILCAEDLDRALSLNPDNPLALLYVMRIGRNTRMASVEFDRYFEQVTEIVPFFNQAYQEKSLYLAPNWHGDAMSMLTFAKKSTMSAPRGTAIPLLLPQAHDNVCKYDRHCQKSEYYNQPEVWQDIESSYMRLIEDFPRSGVYAYWFAKRAKKAGKMKIAKQYYEIALTREPNNQTILSKAKQFR